MKQVIVVGAVLALMGCAKEGTMDVTQLRRPEKSLMTPACEAPPYPRDEGNPEVRARWLIADGQCDALNRTKVQGLQDYVRAITSRTAQQ